MLIFMMMLYTIVFMLPSVGFARTSGFHGDGDGDGDSDFSLALVEVGWLFCRSGWGERS